jgi:ferredoxin
MDNNMPEVTINLNDQKSEFRKKVEKMLPDNILNLCDTCDICAKGCPATGLEDMDPRKFIRMIAQGMDEEALSTPWIWMCTMCERCTYECPAKVDIAGIVGLVRGFLPEVKKPKGIIDSCKMALKNDTCSAMGASEQDFQFIVEDVLAEVRETQEGWEELTAPIDKTGAYYFLNQNSREPVTEPDEMVPLWKILHLAGADWTYGTKGWAAENYCLFAQDLEQWEQIVRIKAKAVDDLGCKVWLNTE